MSDPGSQPPPGRTRLARGPAHLPGQLRSAPAGQKRGNAPAGRQAAVRTSCAVPSLPACPSSGTAASQPSPSNHSGDEGLSRDCGVSGRGGMLGAWIPGSLDVLWVAAKGVQPLFKRGFEARRAGPPPLLGGPGCPRHPGVLFLTLRPRGGPGPASPGRGN